jgi:hypothetical protein
VPLLPAVAEWDVLRQMGNPLRVLTSGIERRAARPRYSSGKWRMCDRVPWWNEYDDSTRVVFGHYWRRLHAQAGSDRKVGLPALFEGTSHDDWLGPRRNAYCVDFSVGERYKERHSNATCFDTALRAVRLPEGLHISDRES